MNPNTTGWNRLRYGALAPLYDFLLAPLEAVGFGSARVRAFELLAPEPGSRLLIVGAGTGLDLPHVPDGVEVVATDLTPAMVVRIRKRAERTGRPVDARVMDGESLEFPEDSFDYVALHLVLAVMPRPEACAREVARVLRPGGAASIFDKFVPQGESPSLLRRLANVPANLLATDLTRSLEPILAAGRLELHHREPRLGGLFTVALAGTRARRPGPHPPGPG